MNCIHLTYWVGGGLLALLVLPVVPSDSAVCSLTLYSLAVRTHQHTGHHAQTTITWSMDPNIGIKVFDTGTPIPNKP